MMTTLLSILLLFGGCMAIATGNIVPGAVMLFAAFCMVLS